MELRMRPRFSATTTHHASIPDALDALTRRIQEMTPFPCQINRFYDQQLEVHVGKPHRHSWSPQLRLWLTRRDGVIHIDAIFGPEPNIWTMFMAGYAIGGMLSLAGVLVCTSQLSLRAAPSSFWGAWLLLVGLLILSSVYALSHLGRHLSMEQMRPLHDAVLACCAQPTRTATPQGGPH